MMINYEMYKIHRQGQLNNKENKSKVSKTQDEEERTKVSVIAMEDDEEMRRLERKKRSQEDMVADFVKILEQMMNPRQAVTSFVSATTGLGAVIVALLYLNNIPETASKAKELIVVLIVYGVLQVLLATAFFVTCMQTSIAVSKGVKDAFQIVVGLLVALVYVAIALISLVVGIFGFYKTICLVSYVEYMDRTSTFFCPPPVFYTSLCVFILHIILIVLKCCCCK
ncbi:unnamed protein product [Auanema sp. JU1783]|nr:unnamed protein product [Auanema sp. JU1783]